MRKSSLLLLALVIAGFEINAQLNLHSDVNKRDNFSRILNYQKNKDSYLSAAKSGEYQKLDSIIRPDYSREKLYYDDKGHNTHYVYSPWDDSYREKEEFICDDNNNLTLVNGYVWDNSSDQWIISYKQEVAYSNNLISTIINMDWEHAQWKNSFKVDYLYNPDNNIINSLYSVWDTVALRWVNDTKYEYSYDENLNRILSLCSVWDTTQWSNESKTTYLYDINGNMILYTDYYWDSSTSLWLQSYKGEYTYDLLKRPILTILSSPNNGENEYELWKSDGTADNTLVVKDIFSGIGSGNPSSFTNVNGIIYFRATDGLNGIELWKSDGTSEGTLMVKDINPGSGSGSPALLTDINGILYFRAYDGVSGNELWKSDGTNQGTVMVKDINPGSGSGLVGKPNNVNGILYFLASNGVNGIELWKSDGTADGTVMVKDIYPGTNSGNPGYLTSYNGLLYFSARGVNGAELWKSDGTTDGTVMVKEINPGFLYGSPYGFPVINNIFYIYSQVATDGWELWKSDGTTEGTVMIKNIFRGSINSFDPRFINMNGLLYFLADDGVNGYELWKSNGTGDGTNMVKDIFPGTNSAFFWQNANLSTFNGALYFPADDGINGNELWKSDGTAEGTVMVKDIYPGSLSGTPHSLTIDNNGHLFFSAIVGNRWMNSRKIDYTYSYTCSQNNLIMPNYREYYYDGFIDITTASFTMRKWDENANNWYITYTKDKYFSGIILLSLSTDSLVFESSESSSMAFDIVSSTSWTVTCDQDWVSISGSKGLGETTLTGSGNATISITASANPTSSKRTALVRVSGTGVSDQIITIEQEGITTGIKDKRIEEGIFIYPNPVSDNLYFKTGWDEVKISIFDMNGKLVLNKQLKDNYINISKLQSGIYTLRIENKTEIKFQKFIKQ